MVLIPTSGFSIIVVHPDSYDSVPWLSIASALIVYSFFGHAQFYTYTFTVQICAHDHIF